MVKTLLRRILVFLHLDLTKNLKYDRLTKAIIAKKVTPGSNCIDIGCHKGEIMDELLHYSITGTMLGIEPIPEYFQELTIKYKSKDNVLLFPIALSNTKGISEFNFVKNAPAYSGLKKRDYSVSKPDIEILTVETDTIDNVVGDLNIDFIKIDVEGGEYQVLYGGAQTIMRCQPTIIFEFGIGASNYYGITPEMMYDLIHNTYGLEIFTLKSYLKSKSPLNLEQLVSLYNSGKEYYFVADKILVD